MDNMQATSIRTWKRVLQDDIKTKKKIIRRTLINWQIEWLIVKMVDVAEMNRRR
jgi:hypothetical protein